MRLSLEHYGKTVVVELEQEDLTIEQVRDELLIPVLLGAGFHPTNVNELFFETGVEDPI
jgi:hypothetical protein